MKRHSYLTITAATLLSAGALMSCGSDNDTLAQAQFTEQANAICVEGDAKNR